MRELRVFMASPGDLTDERDALRDLERRLNAMFRGRGVRVSIEGWEEVLPDAGAPQELINPLVHECDVFVGLLNMRWGTPTDNDSSGFSEEFSIALGRRKVEGSKPAIGMYFRDIDPERLRDKGPQLEAVLAFKERVEAERLVLHKSFSSATHLALQVMNFLLPHLLSLAEEASDGAVDQEAGSAGSTSADDRPETLEAAESKADEAGSVLATADLDSAQRQIASALAAFSNMFISRSPADSPTRDRVFLAAAAFAQDSRTLGAHHVNRLFKRRNDLDLTLGEVNIWYRTFFENYGLAEREYRVVPIWGVVDPDQLGDRFIEDLGTLALDDDENVARGVLRFMSEHQIRPKSLWEPTLPEPDDESGRSDSRAPTRVFARWADLFEKFPGIEITLNYVAAVSRPDDADLIMSIAISEGVDDRTRKLVRIALDVMTDSPTSVADIAPSKYSNEDTSALRDLVVRTIPKVSAEQWNSLLRGTPPAIAIAAALQVVQHEDVSLEQLKSIFALGDVDVEQAIVDRAKREPEWGISKVQELIDIDKFRSANLVSRVLAATLPRDALESLDQGEALSATAWVALTIQHPDDLLESAREVLDGTSEWLMERNAPLMGKYSAIANNTAATARGAACVVLSQTTEITDEDVERVATEIRRDSYVSRSPALRALASMVARLDADPERTVPDLGDLSILDASGFSDVTDLVLDGPLASTVVPIWRDSEVHTLQYASRAWELRQAALPDADLEEALYLDNQELRIVALDELMSRWNNKQLEELLRRYDEQGRPWWYNVIAALDERLYGLSQMARADSDG